MGYKWLILGFCIPLSGLLSIYFISGDIPYITGGTTHLLSGDMMGYAPLRSHKSLPFFGPQLGLRVATSAPNSCPSDSSYMWYFQPFFNHKHPYIFDDKSDHDSWSQPGAIYEGPQKTTKSWMIYLGRT